MRILIIILALCCSSVSYASEKKSEYELNFSEYLNFKSLGSVSITSTNEYAITCNDRETIWFGKPETLNKKQLIFLEKAILNVHLLKDPCADNEPNFGEGKA